VRENSLSTEKDKRIKQQRQSKMEQKTSINQYFYLDKEEKVYPLLQACHLKVILFIK
jgi:hypothetical protein